MARISREDRKAIEAYSSLLLEKLRLQDWFITLHDELPENRDGPNPEITAQIRSSSCSRVAAMRLGDRFFNTNDVDDGLRTQTLIHEHLHLHFQMAWHFFEDLIDAELGHVNASQARRTYRTNMELGIDQLAYALVDRLPEFKLPSGSRRR